jgi:hypothetical protein
MFDYSSAPVVNWLPFVEYQFSTGYAELDLLFQKVTAMPILLKYTIHT